MSRNGDGAEPCKNAVGRWVSGSFWVLSAEITRTGVRVQTPPRGSLWTDDRWPSDVTVSTKGTANRGRSRAAGVMSRCRAPRVRSRGVSPVVETPETGSVPQVESPACVKQTGAVSAARQWRPVHARVHQARGGSHGRSVQADESGDVLSCVRSPGACSTEQAPAECQAVGERAVRPGTVPPHALAGLVCLRTAAPNSAARSLGPAATAMDWATAILGTWIWGIRHGPGQPSLKHSE